MDPELKDGAYILRNSLGKCNETNRECDKCEKFNRECDGMPTDVIILLYFEEGQCGRFITADGKKSRELTHDECVQAIEEYGLLDFIPAEEIMKQSRESTGEVVHNMQDYMERMMEDYQKGGKMFLPDLNKMKN